MLLCFRHVENKRRLGLSGKAFGFLLTSLMLSVTSTRCFSQVYKCVDANSRVTMSDQPCPVKNIVNAKDKIREAQPVLNKETFQTEKEQANTLRESLEKKIQQKHGAECRDMRIQLKKQGHFVSHPLLLDATQLEVEKTLWERYRIGCLAQAKDVVALDEAQREGASADKARKVACDIKTRDYEKRRQLANSTLSDLEVIALATLQAEVMRGCR
jgi:Domain of unknown function (DUF4124)